MGVERILGSNGYEVVLNFFLTGIFARPVEVGFEGVGVKVAEDCEVSDLVNLRQHGNGDRERQDVRTIAAAARIDVIVPRPADLGALLDDNKIPTSAARDHVDGGT